MENVRHGGRYALCGMLLGAGAILPGVSGGVLAVVFGVYRPFMELLTRPKEAVSKYWRLWVPLGLGWCAGFFLLARGLSAVMSRSETVCVWLFIGLIAGSVPALFREAGKDGRPRSAWACFALCALTLCAGFYCVRHVLRVQAAPNFWWYGFCGTLWGLGTVLPGFSASPIMMALGLYRPLLADLTGMDIAALWACIPGAAVSAALFARLMDRLFRTRHAEVSHGILGVVCASTLFMVPLRYSGPGEILLSGVCCGGGFLLACVMGRQRSMA
ncbi:MAG: DUF368 domain-containing protein [Oscillibacter sp.]|nr:DUF368 domain-containing protein [Oscillibacter sp.]